MQHKKVVVAPAGLLEATVVSMLPGGLIKVQLGDRTELLVHEADDMKRVSNRVRPGDSVLVRRAKLDPSRGTIVGP